MVGRPSKKATLCLKSVERLARKGWTDEEMAEFFGVVRSTWCKWKAEDPAFSDALKEWKDEADARVERSLYERAIGYEHPDVHISNYQGSVTLTPIQKKYAPDTTAAIFWLKNRKPDQWRDKTETETTLKGDLSALSDEELDDRIKHLAAIAGGNGGKGKAQG